MTIRTHTLGFPRVGLRRELKKAQESYWAGNATREELLAVGRELRARHWDQQKPGSYKHLTLPTTGRAEESGGCGRYL
ncbi:hypothetical protein, partial [Enterobacter hormaechei]|uniref:hypothetical protein n=1 Tax=Enterobacter hormaechei TaxID=158836 RepID=UPI003CC70BDD